MSRPDPISLHLLPMTSASQLGTSPSLLGTLPSLVQVGYYPDRPIPQPGLDGTCMSLWFHLISKLSQVRMEHSITFHVDVSAVHRSDFHPGIHAMVSSIM